MERAVHLNDEDRKQIAESLEESEKIGRDEEERNRWHSPGVWIQNAGKIKDYSYEARQDEVRVSQEWGLHHGVCRQ